MTFQNAHRANVLCVASHPYSSEYFLSGGMDTTIKLWNKREKSVLQEFKNISNNASTTCVGFSPDSYYVISGNHDGKLFIWDCRASKLLKSFDAPHMDETKTEDNSIITIKFHPTEFLLSTSHSDGTVHLWNLNNQFSHAATIPKAQGPVRAMSYSEHGKEILLAADGGLRVYGGVGVKQEPLVQHENIDLRWNEVCDMSISTKSNQVCVITKEKNTLSSFIVLASKLAPWSQMRPESANTELPKPPSTPLLHNQVSRRGTDPQLPPLSAQPTRNVSTPMYPGGVQPRNVKTTDNDGDTNMDEPVPRNSPPKRVELRRQSPKPEAKQGFEEPKKESPAPVRMVSDDEVISLCLGSGGTMCSVLYGRLNNIKILRRLIVEQRDVKEAVKILIKLKDHALAVDVIRHYFREKSFVREHFNVDLAIIVLPLLKELISTPYEE